MRRFTLLFEAIDQTTSTNRKVAAMVAYFRDAAALETASPEEAVLETASSKTAPPEDAAADAAWALWLLLGNRFKRVIPRAELVEAAELASGLPPWLFRESYDAVGDMAETIALLVENMGAEDTGAGGTGTGGTGEEDRVEVPLHVWMERVRAFPALSPEARRETLLSWWRGVRGTELFLITKLLTGEFRVGVSQILVSRAIATLLGQEPAVVAHHLMGAWSPTPEAWATLARGEQAAADNQKPYPFMLASPLTDPPESLGGEGEWLAEWKWDGIRAQIIRREGTLSVWSRGEELLTDRFPEVLAVAEALPLGTVLDGELVAWRDGRVMPFAALQTRIGRKKLEAAVLEAAPVVFLAFDLLEHGGESTAELPFRARREALAAILVPFAAPAAPSLPPPAGLFPVPPPLDGVLQLSEAVVFDSWERLGELRAEARERGVEGFVIKRLSSPYRPGRHRGDWWKWKVDPFTMDAVLIYAQPGSGKRAGLHTDYTFGIWKGDTLVTVAKAYSGLDNAELEEMDRWIRANTLEKHGPVRVVKPEKVFELAFEGLAPSPRHKSGVAVRFPRIVRFRSDKRAEEADRIETLQAMLAERS